MPNNLRKFRRRSAEELIRIRESSRMKWTRKQLLKKHEGRCHLCGQQVELSDETSPRYATIDHIVPLSKGGRDTLDNLALACVACNRAKGDKIPEGATDG